MDYDRSPETRTRSRSSRHAPPRRSSPKTAQTWPSTPRAWPLSALRGRDHGRRRHPAGQGPRRARARLAGPALPGDGRQLRGHLKHDVLRDEGEAYARKLAQAVSAVRFNGTIHDFVLLNAIADTPPVRSALRQATAALGEALRPRA